MNTSTHAHLSLISGYLVLIIVIEIMLLYDGAGLRQLGYIAEIANNLWRLMSVQDADRCHLRQYLVVVMSELKGVYCVPRARENTYFSPDQTMIPS